MRRNLACRRHPREQKSKKARAKDLTTSEISRQNILNNPVALPRIREALEIKPLEFNGVLYVTKQMAADFYGVDLRTIENCLSANEKELHKNGYRALIGKELKELKSRFDTEIDFGIKTVRLGLFDFRSFLNIGMLLTTSEKAKWLETTRRNTVPMTADEENDAILASHKRKPNKSSWQTDPIVEPSKK